MLHERQLAEDSLMVAKRVSVPCRIPFQSSEVVLPPDFLECRLCQEVCDLSLSTTKERLAKYLLERYEEIGRKQRFLIPMTQSALASYLGTVRETLSRDLSALRKARVISFSQKKFQVVSPKELARIAGVQEKKLAVI